MFFSAAEKNGFFTHSPEFFPKVPKDRLFPGKKSKVSLLLTPVMGHGGETAPSYSQFCDLFTQFSFAVVFTFTVLLLYLMKLRFEVYN